MKTFILSAIIMAASTHLYAQESTERENKLFELFNNFSTAYLFNTYGLIGSIADGFGHEVYDEKTTMELLSAQKKLASDLVVLLEKKLTDDLFDAKKKEYLLSFTQIIKEFNVQIDLFFKVVKNNTKKNLYPYYEQRKKSWKDISTLVGIKD
jgi:hypothetical protein